MNNEYLILIRVELLLINQINKLLNIDINNLTSHLLYEVMNNDYKHNLLLFYAMYKLVQVR